MKLPPVLLTLNSHGESVARRWRDSIASHAKIIAHVQTTDLSQPQLGVLDDLMLLSEDDDVITVLSPPNYVWLWVAVWFAGESNILSFSDNHIAGSALNDLWGDYEAKSSTIFI